MRNMYQTMKQGLPLSHSSPYFPVTQEKQAPVILSQSAQFVHVFSQFRPNFFGAHSNETM